MARKESNLPTMKTLVSAVGSITATVVLIRGFTQEFLPPELQYYLFSSIRSFLGRFSNQMTMVIDEFEGWDSNEIYKAAEVYLGPKISPAARWLRISKPEKEKHLNIRMECGEEVEDTFEGVRFKWVWICRPTEVRFFHNPRDANATMKFEPRSFALTFHRRHKELAINSYLPYITNEAKRKNQEKRTIKIFSVDYPNMYTMNDVWRPLVLDHPATFDTLAMDPNQKDMILKDLDRFLRRREYYRNVGKAWKRGYLLYGPPGTGKSSLIAAIANYLNFDVYDLELTELRKNSELRKLLVATANKSILVVEDIDCTIDLQEMMINRNISRHGLSQDESKVTLSGLLNFVDGLWSSCGDQRIIIFTTNHIEKLDPALLRPGRMDLHINMSYCMPSGFRLLASNYLGIEEHSLFKEIEGLIRNANVTPAEVAEQLLKDDNPDASLGGLIELLHKKMTDNDEAGVQRASPETLH